MKLFVMGYNRGKDFMEPYNLGATSNGVGPFAATEGLTASMSNLSVSTGNQGNSGGATDTPGYTSNQSSNTSSQDKSSLARTNSTPFNPARTNLNPNAAEFVPKAYKPATTGMNGNPWDDQKSLALSVNGENEVTVSRLDRTNSSNSNASDDEYRRFCRSQLPDDLMPDFDVGDFVEVTDNEESELLDVSGGSSLPSNWIGGAVANTVQGENFMFDDRVHQTAVKAASYSPPGATGTRYTSSEGSTSSMGPSFARPYMPELRSPAQQLNANRERQASWTDGNESGTSFSDWGSTEFAFPEDLGEVFDPISVLSTKFPGFASESLAEIYYANGGDLGLTMEMLTELEVHMLYTHHFVC